VYILIEEYLFYWSHRLLHVYFYQDIHKRHHEFRAPISIAAEYAHPIELILSNIFPLIAGPMLLGSHIFTVWLWLILAITGTCNHHCGYHLPWLKGLSSPEFHDYHHYNFNSNFGLMGYLDYLYDTNKGYHDYVTARKQLGDPKLRWINKTLAISEINKKNE